MADGPAMEGAASHAMTAAWSHSRIAIRSGSHPRVVVLAEPPEAVLPLVIAAAHARTMGATDPHGGPTMMLTRSLRSLAAAVALAVPVVGLASLVGSPPAGAAFICAYAPEGDVIVFSPMQTAIVQAALKATGSAKVAFLMGGRDLVRMDITPDRSLRPNETIVQLDNFADITWDKALHPVNHCSGQEAVIFKRATTPGPVGMRITRAVDNRPGTFDTVEFHKPGFLGVWYQAGELDPGSFWALAGGNRVTFIWIHD
jgi:hypothetical protein